MLFHGILCYESYIKRGVNFIVISRKNKVNIVTLVLIILLEFPSFTVLAVNQSADVNSEILKSEVERIYNIRSSCLVSGETAPLKDQFDTSQRTGRYALEHEIKRVNYLKSWSNEHGIKFKNIKSSVRIKKVMPRGKITRLALEESYKFDYIYKDDPNAALNSFGVGIRHVTSVIPKGGRWVICSDWYTDCFEDALQSYTLDDQSNLNSLITKFLSLKDLLAAKKSNKVINYRREYDRINAIAYADRYCGAAWGSGNNFKYNPKYMDFNGAGGDCTNFTSQILGDKGAGGLPQDGTWHCHIQKYGMASGSRAWTNADALKNYLIYSGKARVIKVGTFKELITPSNGEADAPISKLDFGDIVCYEKGRGNIDHFAVITSFDSKGYPLVNSHTTDRYHVPWDLGWGDRGIRFFLIHVK